MFTESNSSSNDTLSVLLDIPGYRVARPIPYHVEIVDGEIVAIDDEFDRYGTGTTLAQARISLANQISDYFDTLRGDADSLAKCALRDYRRMVHYVSRISV